MNIAKLPEQFHGSPDEFYRYTHTEAVDHLPRTYATMPMSSAGARLVLENDPYKAMEVNGLWAMTFCQYVNEKNTLVVPASLKNMTYTHDGVPVKWNEGQFLIFWIMTIYGIPPEASYEFYDEIHHRAGINWQTLNDHHADKTVRKTEYDQLSHVSKILGKRLAQNPIKKTSIFPGGGKSLGSQVETTLSRDLGVPIRRLLINLDSKHFSALKDHLPHYQLFQLLLQMDSYQENITRDCDSLPIVEVDYQDPL